ncbi:MAG: VTT domain-containing protein [Patescibacteria group bacterium]
MNIRHAKISEQLGVIGLLVTIGVLVLIAFFVDMEALKAYVLASGPFAPLVFILLKASTVIIAPLSGAPLYPIVGLFFGFWPGLLYVLIGDFLGYTGAFFLARRFGYPFVRKMIAGNEHGLLSRVVEHVGTVKGFIHMCLTCFALPELISYGTGLSRLPYPIFISILLPLSAVMSATLVLFGSLLDFSEGSLLITIGMPLVGGVIIFIGGYLFLRGVNEKA